MRMLGLPVTTCIEMTVACVVCGGVLFCAVLSPRDILDEIWDRVGSVHEDFPYLVLHESKTNMGLFAPRSK